MLGWQSMFTLPPGETERRVQARLVRQQLLTQEHPLELSVVLDQSALHRGFGDNVVMRRQLVRVADACGLPNVEVRVLPLDGHTQLAIGAFTYLQFAPVNQVPLHDTVTVEHLKGTLYLEDESRTHEYRVAFEHLWTRALGPTESRDLIADTAQRLWS